MSVSTNPETRLSAVNMDTLGDHVDHLLKELDTAIARCPAHPSGRTAHARVRRKLIQHRAYIIRLRSSFGLYALTLAPEQSSIVKKAP